MILLAFLISVFAQGTADPPTVELKLDSKEGKPGGTLKGKVLVTFAPGWHGYQNPPQNEFEIPVKVDSATKDLKLKATYPKGQLEEFAGTKTMAYSGTISIPVALTLPKKKGTYPFKIEVSYQQCNESSCLPPGKVVVQDKLNLKSKA